MAGLQSLFDVLGIPSGHSLVDLVIVFPLNVIGRSIANNSPWLITRGASEPKNMTVRVTFEYFANPATSPLADAISKFGEHEGLENVIERFKND
jgi:hypothetical protein